MTRTVPIDQGAQRRSSLVSKKILYQTLTLIRKSTNIEIHTVRIKSITSKTWRFEKCIQSLVMHIQYWSLRNITAMKMVMIIIH